MQRQDALAAAPGDAAATETLAGLMANHGIDPEAYLDEVHDVSLDSLTPDPPLRDALARLVSITNAPVGAA